MFAVLLVFYTGWQPPIIGAGRRIRTDDLLITNQLLYQLSYAGKLHFPR